MTESDGTQPRGGHGLAPAPTGEQIMHLAATAGEARRALAEASMRRIAHLLLSYRPELAVVFIEVDEEGDYAATGVSADRDLHDTRKSDPLDHYKDLEITRGCEGELAGLIANLTGYERGFYPYTGHHSRIDGCYSLDLAALRNASVPPL